MPMKRIPLIFSTFLLILLTTKVFAQDDLKFFNYWGYYSDIENVLYKHFCDIAFEQLEDRALEVGQIGSEDGWLTRKSRIKDKLLDITGPFPEKTPLNVQTVKKIKKEDYTIETVIYESLPGYYVTGALYLPAGIKNKAPAIFYACGHSTEGFRVAIYQHIIINLVKKGFVVFTIDPMGQGERYEYWDEAINESRFPVPDHEHSYAGAQCLISGYATARYFIWDIIRGIDLMMTRKEVDPERIGITGRSGGGNMAAYLGAIDDRIYAAAPECYVTSYEHIYKSIGPQCAEQNLYQMIAEKLDHADFIMARAPKPTMIISTSRDFFSNQGTLESYAEAKRMYTNMGAGENLMLAVDDTIHRSSRKNREAMYAFFQKYLKNPGNPVDLEVEVPEPGELQVSETGQLTTSFEGQSIFSLNSAIIAEQQEALVNKREKLPDHADNSKKEAMKISGFSYPKSFEGSIFSGRFVRADYVLEKYLVPGSGDYVLPIVLYKPVAKGKNEIVLILDSDGLENAASRDSLVQSLTANGYAALLMDLPGIGMLGPGYLKGDSYIHDVSYNQWFASVLTGKSNTGLRAADIIRGVHFIKDELKAYSSISAISIGPVGSDLLHAASFEPGIDKIGIIHSFLSYANIGMTRFYKPDYVPFIVAGAIKEYDLPDLIAGLTPRKVLIMMPLSASGTSMDEETMREFMKFPQRSFASAGVADNLEIVHKLEEHETPSQRLLNWLK